MVFRIVWDNCAYNIQTTVSNLYNSWVKLTKTMGKSYKTSVNYLCTQRQNSCNNWVKLNKTMGEIYETSVSYLCTQRPNTKTVLWKAYLQHDYLLTPLLRAFITRILKNRLLCKKVLNKGFATTNRCVKLLPTTIWG